ncbi:MAG: transglutaminase-like domain-containing protein [Reyranella sp.]|uniref:SirB1 family protein n=1 Tax=Reyranella sp. TaxID=1929291 RepID=UPI00272FBC39|nr:transglutaminase-like domain-containing protein [Reyranella sp.]MDP1965330.1 transglutaminase-like domain-containing protein [Reyranella sp.]MDP2376078.1 transglutaminase-like domain-containing protein [Reyranella sp.]
METTKGLARLRDLCAGDGKRLDLLEAALALSVLRNDDALDLPSLRQHVAAMSAAVADLVRRRGPTPESLAEVIAQAYAYRGDSETYDDLQNADLARVIERRKGLPVALSILYLHVARAQGWHAEGLAFPGHFLIRVGIEDARHVIDPFHDGCVRDASDLRELLRQVLGPTAELKSEHFDPVFDRDVLLRLENNVRLRLVKREDWDGAAQSLDRMLAIAPDQPELLFEAGQLNSRLDKRRAAIAALERFLAVVGRQGDAGLRQRATALLQELRRGLN